MDFKTADRASISNRLLKIHPDNRVAEVLLEQGFHSALQIANFSSEHFVREMAPHFSGDTTLVKRIYDHASQIRSTLFHAWANVKTAIQSPQFNALRVANVSPEAQARFASLPDYEDLFGSLDYCSCDECQSIFGPAAYLVDLLRIVDAYVTLPNEHTIPDYLQFAKRRGDLGDIPLTCEMTNRTFPQLRIVNERLDALARTLFGVAADKDLFEVISTLTYPFNLPFHLPLEQITLYLSELKVSVGAIFRTFGMSASDIARGTFNMSRKQYTFITTSLASNVDALAASYGVSSSNIDNLFGVDAFLDATGLTLDALRTLVTQNLSDAEIEAGVNANFYINAGSVGKALAYVPGDAQTQPRIGDPSHYMLDRISRFVRLATQLNWDYAQLDWALRIASEGNAPLIDDATLQTLADIVDIARQAQLDIPTVCVLLGPIKTYGAGNGSVSTAPFDVIFNDPTMLDGNKPYHPKPNALNPLYTDGVLTWNVGGFQAEDLQRASRLAGSLGITLNTLNQLGSKLFDTGQPVFLTIENLSALYRHTILMRMLGMPPDQYFVFMQIGGWLRQTFKAVDIRTLLTQSSWLKTTRLTVYQLDYFLNATPSPYVDPLYRSNAVGDWLRIVWQATTNLTAADEKDKKDKEDEKLASLLAGFFNIPTDTLATMMKMVVKATPPTPLDRWQAAFLTQPQTTGGDAPCLTYINSVLMWISRWFVLTNAIDAPIALLESVLVYPGAYGMSETSLKSFVLADVVSLSTFVQLMKAFQDTSNGLIDYVNLSQQQSPKTLTQLAQTTGWDRDQVQALLAHFTPQESRVTVISMLQREFALLHTLGANVSFITHFLAIMTSPTSPWSDLTTLASQIRAKVKAGLPDAQWAPIAQQIDGAVAERIRNILLPLVLAEFKVKHPEINSPRHLSEYLLLDVEVSGVLQISYVREALNAAQLYLQRCRLLLEDGVEQLDIPDVWWEWLMNYRSWVANRQIFLYPENYIDPALRKTQTQLFSDLKNQLLQGNITDQTVDTIIRTYIDELCKIAQLEYVDAYHEIVKDPERGEIDTTFLFARTATEPYTYYYITYDTNVWSAWKKIDLTIPTALITPAYAFNHLFLFWVELKTSKQENLDNQTSPPSSRGVAYSATVKYSFTTFNDTWIQPQTLIADEVIYFMPSEKQQQGSLGQLTNRAELFHMTDLFWNKVSVNVIRGGISAIHQGSADEWLCVFYGPFMEKGPGATTLDTPTVLPTMVNATSHELNFQQKIFDIVTTYNQLVNANVLGYLPMMNTFVLDRDLKENFLKRNNEVIILEKDFAENAPPVFKLEIDALSGALKLTSADSAHQSNYMADYTPPISSTTPPTPVTNQSFITANINSAGSQSVYNDLVRNYIVKDGVVDKFFNAQTNLSFLFTGAPQAEKDRLIIQVRKMLFHLRGDRTVFGKIPSGIARVIAVKNQPGSFLFDTGDEAYLLVPQGARYTKLSTATSIASVRSSPLVFDEYFKSVDAMHYHQIFLDLVGNHIVRSDGEHSGRLSDYFDAHTDLSFLFAGTSGETKAVLINKVRRILLNLPSLTVLRYVGNKIPHVVRTDSFITRNIDQAGSRQIFQDLLGNNVIDRNGVVMSGFSKTTDLSFLFAGASEEQKQQLISEVRDILLQLPKFVQKDSFVSPNIDAARSQEVFATLLSNKVIDEPGMVSAQFSLRTDLSFLFPNIPEPRKSTLIAEVRSVLLQFYYSTYQIYVNGLNLDVGRISARSSSRELSYKMFFGGVDATLALAMQNTPVVPGVPFDRLSPNGQVVSPPVLFDGAQIDFAGPYGLYHWELFFHVPMLMASSLSLNQQYAAAKKWLEFILDPTAIEVFVQTDSFVSPHIDAQHSQTAYRALKDRGFLGEVSTGKARVTSAFTPMASLDFLFTDITDPVLRQLMIREVSNVLENAQLATPASHYWQFRPFRNHTLETLEALLINPSEILTYNNDPFDPHAIARLRIGAYEKAIVMKYIDNLLAWADMLFSQYTWESITNALLLYTYAADLLGPKPKSLAPCKVTQPLTFNKIKEKYESGHIPQFFIYLEDRLSLPDELPVFRMDGDAFHVLDTYFCVPENDKLSSYWGRVADRLNKIRNGMTIDGISTPLSLFEPPIDPMRLVRLAASGSSVPGITQNGAPKFCSHYRFTTLYDQAVQITTMVTQLGSGLLAALERRDAEQLEVLRQTNELTILNLTTTIKQQQIDEIQTNIDGLTVARQRAKDEVVYYTNLKMTGLSEEEVTSQNLMIAAIAFQTAVIPIRGIAIAGYLAPSIFGLADGGMKWGDAIGMGAEISGATSMMLQLSSSLAETKAQYDHRSEEWDHQIVLNSKEVDILQKQIDALNMSKKIAQQELTIHNRSITQANEIDAFLRTRFTNGDLYNWMVGRISTIYFQAYRMAVDAAKAAELAYQYELNKTDTFINIAYWDSLKRGLLAGETLMFSLLQMKKAYLDGNVRKLAINKTISLQQLDPQQILNLRNGKPCTFDLTEAMFDFDFPGHYARQIASISVSIPAVVGPYQNINAVLVQMKNTVVTKPSKEVVKYLVLPPKKGDQQPGESDGLRQGWLPLQRIALSRGVNDNGMFELNFGDDRYLPFEGTGAVSSWMLAIPPENNRINLEQLTDVIIDLKYTALDGGSTFDGRPSFRKDVIDILKGSKIRYSGKLYLDLRQAFSSEWYTFMHPQGVPTAQTLNFKIVRNMFPYFRSMRLDSVAVKLDTASVVSIPKDNTFINLVIGKSQYPLTFNAGLASPQPWKPLEDTDFLGSWSLQVTLASVPDKEHLLQNGLLNPQNFLNFELILTYSVDVFG